MAWPKPETDDIRNALTKYAPHLADEPVSFLDEGWEFWAFRAGDYVLLFPKQERGHVWKLADQSSTESLHIERSLTPELAPRLSTPTAVTEIHAEQGPNGAPFAGHRFIPGEVVMYARRRPGAGFGRAFGKLLRELHSFPVERAMQLGVPRFDGPRLRLDRV